MQNKNILFKLISLFTHVHKIWFAIHFSCHKHLTFTKKKSSISTAKTKNITFIYLKKKRLQALPLHCLRQPTTNGKQKTNKI